MIWLILSFFIYAFNNVVWKWTVKDEHPIYLISRRAVFTFLFTLIFLLLTQEQAFEFIYHPDFYLILISSLFGTSGLILMINFLKQGSLTRLSYYIFLGLGINGVYTYILEKIPITSTILIGSAILLLGYLGFILDERKKIKSEPVLLSQHLMLFSMTVCFSIATLISWKALKSFDPLSLMVTQELMVLIVTTVLYLFILKPKRQTTAMSYIRFPLMAAVIMLAVFTGLLGLKDTNPFISGIAGVSIPLLTALFGSLFFKEKLNWTQVTSFTVIVVGELVLF